MTRLIARLPLVLCVALVGCGRPAATPTAPVAAFDVVEAGIPEIQAALQSGRLTSRQQIGRAHV